MQWAQAEAPVAAMALPAVVLACPIGPVVYSASYVVIVYNALANWHRALPQVDVARMKRFWTQIVVCRL